MLNDWLNSGNTPKSPSSWSKNGRAEVWWDMYPPNPAKSWIAGGWGQIAIEEEGGQHNWRFRKIKGEGVREFFFCISTLESFSCTSETMFLHIWKLDSVYFYLLIHYLMLPLWILFFPSFRNLLCRSRTSIIVLSLDVFDFHNWC